MDVVIPIVFPDFKITVKVKKREVDVLPFVDFDNFSIPEYKDKLSNLGHAGVLFINGKTGTTKYYEYGRYDPPANLGLVLKARNLPNVKVTNGSIDYGSLKKTLGFISRVSGQSGRIKAVYIEVEDKYNLMLEAAESRKLKNSIKTREPYDLLTNSCIHFVKEITESAGVSTPWIIDPRPNSYIGEFMDDFPNLEYKNSTNKLSLEDIGVF
ncbi:hypothetical protein [Motiliproteus sp. MSK22-1]|uniref:hypothetical protein n=1 Tax=Motiliproteus sp. MSK22-1 TaxID=1897630 RepID=UPI0009780023|nr:hypothetical protein [Motiliproteus sp. MSK22-1]OMH27149.1 hypothetical protein BGP75_22820 [Motiliproteus sp. MSK22-1]